MMRYGDKVIIRDGSRLDGADGIVYQVRDGQVLVLIDREVFWLVSERHLDRAGHAGHSAKGAAGDKPSK